MLISAEDRLSRARAVLERRRETAADLLPQPIAESWMRCLAAGLDPRDQPKRTIVDDTTLREARQRRDLLRRVDQVRADESPQLFVTVEPPPPAEPASPLGPGTTPPEALPSTLPSSSGVAVRTT